MAGPHLLFLLAEQIRFDVLGAYGDKQCPTPRLDTLAQRSAIFDRHFTPCPLTIPARASLMTGLHPRQHGSIINGWIENEKPFATLRPGLDLLPLRLLEAGYRVVHVGVQHVRAKPEFHAQLPGVEFVGPPGPAEYHHELEQRGLMLGDRSLFRDPVIDYDQGRPVVFSSSAPRPSVFPLREDLHYDELISREMARIIQTHASDKPLALFGMFGLAHPPMWSPRAFASMIDPAGVELPGTVGRLFSGMPAMQLANIPGQLGAHLSLDQWKQVWAAYMGMIALLDRCVGRVLAAADYAGILDSSITVFTSGHGEMLGSHRLYGKMCLYEEACRVPLMIKLPGQTRGRRVTDLTQHMDLTATLLEAGGAVPIAASSGQSLIDLAHGRPTPDPRQAVFAAYDGNGGRGFAHRMVRTATHKLIHNINDRAELYDLMEDPREIVNLSGKETVKAVEPGLREMLNRWMDEMGDDAARC
ncbi:MAG: sulfatase-like hydrolase/transferase [Planctomycetota bacterium]|nr:sulfatase-like hydrolase/transferase [Planctomycetota bacterium]